MTSAPKSANSFVANSPDTQRERSSTRMPDSTWGPPGSTCPKLTCPGSTCPGSTCPGLACPVLSCTVMARSARESELALQPAGRDIGGAAQDLGGLSPLRPQVQVGPAHVPHAAVQLVGGERGPLVGLARV